MGRHLDISGFYTNFAVEKLSEVLPLPNGVVGRVAVGRRMAWQACGAHSLYVSPTALIEMARLGIPQGSSISPIIAMIECSRLVLSPGTVVVLVNYMDYFLLLAHSKEELEERVQELREAVEALPGGHFSLKLKHLGHLEDGCDFLGHHLRLEGNKLVISPSDANYARLLHKVHDLQEGCGVFKSFNPYKALVIQAAVNIRNYLVGWIEFFRECDDLEVSCFLAIRQDIDAMLVKVGATSEDLKGVQPTCKFNEARHSYL